jgi:predicted ATP-binding protein involved in virulence
MYLKSINIDNVGAIKKLIIDLPFNKDGNPEPIILVGRNGSGKTLVMSSILDSLIQIKRNFFQEIPEVKENNFYKAGKKDYISTGESYSFINFQYIKTDTSLITYRDIATHTPAETRTLLQHYGINFQHDFDDNGFHREVAGDFKGIFGSELILYFPVNRYYSPAWLVEKDDVRIKTTEKYVGKDNSNIIKMDVINEVESWILDVILDRSLYEQQTKITQLYEKKGDSYTLVNIPMMTSIPGRNTGIVNEINKILFTMLKVKLPDIDSARFGISSKESGRRVSIIVGSGGVETTIAPTFSHLSSGETMIVALFCSIIRDYDKIGKSNLLDTKEIRGLVVIDEIDLNLHIEYTKDVLPEMLRLFPKIQFIMTSHSPFFLVGMKEAFGSSYTVFNMPNGEIINESDFSEMKKAYSIFIKEFDEFSETLDKVKLELLKGENPIIVTEGKTDWRHIKNALYSLQSRGEYSEIKIDFHEYDDDSFSDSKLNTFLENIKLLNNNRKIIGIFDRDEGHGKQYAKNTLNELGNNVFAVSIPQPNFRSYHEGVCIELMYRDEDLLREDANGRRIYLSSEFNTIGRLVDDVTIGVSNASKTKSFLSKSKEKIVDSEVYDNESNSLALSKINFVRAIENKTPPFDQVDISSFSPLFDILREIIQR